MGYYFIVAAEQPLDFSRLDFVPDEDRWDLGRVGETVYEDPYVAIDAYVAALIPDWEVAPYALDFIEYSVGESHSYPRFLRYDCHGQRPYTNWNPYTYACTDFRVVLWDDPYYYPAYRYAGTRVVFPRPLRNRPRYTVVVGATGEGWSPLVRYRQAPPLPRRATQYKELGVATTPSSAAPTRRPQNRVPSAGIRSAAPRRPASAPSRAAANPNATRRTAEAATPSAASPRHTNSSGSTPRAATSRPGTSSRRAEQPANARPGTSRSASPWLATPSRPTLQRRPAAKTTRGATSGRTNASRPNLRPSTSRGSAVSGWRTRVVAPSRPSGPPRAQPQTQQRRRGSAMPTRSAPSTRSRPTATRARPTTTRAASDQRGAPDDVQARYAIGSGEAPDCERPAEAPAETWRTWRLTRPSGFRTRSRTEPVCFLRDHRFGLRPPLTR